MRRALSFIVLLFFAATSEGAALCLTTRTTTATPNHTCCPEQFLPSSSVATCCALSRPESESPTSDSQSGGGPSVAVPVHFDQVSEVRNVIAPFTRQARSIGTAPSDVPLYLQHLSLLI